MKWIVKSIKWLIYTNLYIAIAAVCFQATAYFFGVAKYWSIALLSTTFFSTWLVYQFSRYHFHRNYNTHPNGKENGIYNFVNSHQKFLHISIVLAFIGTLISAIFLKIETLVAMAILGGISIVYPIRYKNWSLRSIPFIKIFLIAFVWASTATWIPFLQEGYGDLSKFEILSNVIPYFIFDFLFILFITLPFDMHDVSVDRKLNVKTIPVTLGIKKSRVFAILSGLALIILIFMLFRSDIAVILAILIIIILGLITISKVEKLHKWEIMAIYDGSMMVLFLILLFDYLML